MSSATRKYDTPSRLRAVRAYRDVLRFLESASVAELAEYARRFSPEDRATIYEMTKRARTATPSAERAGRPPKMPVDSRSLFQAIEYIAELRRVPAGYERKHMIALYQRLTSRKGSLLASALWDELPADAKSSVAIRTRTRTATRGGGRTRKNAPVRGFAVVHSAEKPWVKEPNYRRWIGKLRRHTAKVRLQGEEEHPMNLCVDSDICKGDLGIPRKLMPQFNSARDIASFIKFAEGKYGVKSRRARRRAGQLRPSQEEINRERVEDVADDIRYKKLDPNVPLIVSSDNYVIDGHHRWAAYRVDKPRFKMPVLVVEAPARDVLSIAATWGAKHQQF